LIVSGKAHWVTATSDAVAWLPLVGAEEVAGEGRCLRAIPPIHQLAAQRLIDRGAAQHAFGGGVDLVERGIDRRDIAAVAVQEEEPPEAVPGERQDIVVDDLDQGRGPHGHRSWEIHVVDRHADADGRADEGVGRVADAAGDHFPRRARRFRSGHSARAARSSRSA